MKRRSEVARIAGVLDGSERRAGYRVPYRIVVKGEVGSTFSGPLRGVTLESVAAESTLLIEVVDQSHLLSVIEALGDRGVEIVALDRATPAGRPQLDPAPDPDGAPG